MPTWGARSRNAVLAYKDDVKSGAFPSEAESYHLPKDTQAALSDIAERKHALRS